MLGGFSMGSVMSYALGLGPGRPAPAGILAFSGFVPVVEGWQPELPRPTRVFIAHGRQDPIMEIGFARRARDLLEQHGTGRRLPRVRPRPLDRAGPRRRGGRPGSPRRSCASAASQSRSPGAGMFLAVAGFDAVFVGSGVNSLTGAALLARGGWNVCVLERNDALGGAHPHARRAHRARLHARADGVVAPALRGLRRLRRAGRRPGRATGSSTSTPTCRPATLFPDGGAAFLTTSLEDNVAEFARHAAGDGAAWSRQFEQFMASAEHSFGVLSAELWSQQGLDLARKAYSSFGRRGLLAFAGSSLVSARDWLDATFESERAHGLLAPWVLHTGLGPEQAVSGFMTQVIACAVQLGGMPVPKGGGVRLVEALAAIVRENGGELRTGAGRRARAASRAAGPAACG